MFLSLTQAFETMSGVRTMSKVARRQILYIQLAEAYPVSSNTRWYVAVESSILNTLTSLVSGSLTVCSGKERILRRDRKSLEGL